MKRPALYTFIYFAAGITAAFCLKGKGLMLFAFLAVISCCYLYFKIKNLSVFILAVAFGTGALAMGACTYREYEFSKYGCLKGDVYDIDFNSNGGQTVTLKNTVLITDDGDEITVDGRSIIYTYEGVYVRRGDYIGIKFSGLKSEEENYVSGFNYNQYVLLNNIAFTANADEVYLLGHSGNLMQKLLDLRDKTGNLFENIYPKTEASVLKAIILGDTSDLSSETRSLYNSAGISHILAVSGLHTAVISLMVIRLLNLLGLNRRKAAFIAVLIISFYAVFAGGKASIVRSAVMINIYLLARIVYREADTLNSMGLAGLALLIFNPYSLFSVGFQLSFVSVAAVLIFSNICEESKTSFLNKIKSSAALSLFVSVCTIPIVAYNFYDVPVYGFITNIFVIPVLGVLTVIGFISAVLSVFSLEAGIFTGGIVFVILKFINVICICISHLPLSVINVGRPSIVFIVLFYSTVQSFVVLKDCRRNRIISVLVTAFCVFSVISNKLIFKYSTVDFLPSDYGGGAVVKTYKGNVYLIGQGGKGGFYNEAENVLEYVCMLGSKKADALFLDGTDKYDINFAVDLMNIDGTDLIFIPKGSNENNEGFQTLLFTADKTDTDIKYIAMPDCADFDNSFEISCLFPDENLKSGISSGNAVFKFAFGSISFLYLGDITKELEFLSFAGADISSEVLYCNNEVLCNKSVSDFIYCCKADYVITDSAEDNDLNVLDTESIGKISFKTNGTNLFIDY